MDHGDRQYQLRATGSRERLPLPQLRRVDTAKKHIDPAHPKSGPYGINADTDPTNPKSVLQGGVGLSDARAASAQSVVLAIGQRVDILA
jgi:hypothetical protein